MTDDVPSGMRAEMLALLADAELARNDARRQGAELRPLGKKARRTRGELLRAAYECFVANGYRATSVEDIHGALGVSIGTFYQYFRDKADVMTTLVAESILASSNDMVDEPAVADPDQGPRTILPGFIRNYAASAPFQAVWEEATHFESTLADFRRRLGSLVESSLAEQIVAGQRSGTVKATVDAAEAARALSAMVDRYCYLTFVVEGRTDPASVDAATELIIALWQNALVMGDTF